MYTVQYTQNFEDFVVGERKTFNYESIGAAARGFKEITEAFLHSSEEIDELRQHIEDYHAEDEDVDSFAAGIKVKMFQERVLIAKLTLMFDPRSNTLKFGSDLEIFYEHLSANEEDVLHELSLGLQSDE
jgi:uncharacterized protein YqkB